MEFSPFMKQVFIAAAPQLGAVSLGGSLGYPCALLQQFKSNESSIRPDFDTMTWIASMHGIAGIGAILMPTIMQLRGRKFTFMGSCLLLIIGWALAFGATDAYMVLLAEVFLGLGSNCTVIINLMTISEMLAPKYRTVSMMLLGISQSIGMVLVTSLGTIVHWKKLALIMCSPVVIALIMITLWPESPSWLVYKGKFEECQKAFTWLRGSDDDAKKELQALMIAQRENERMLTEKSTWQEIRDKLRRKDFYMPSLHMFLIIFNFYISGGVCLVIHSKDIMETATGDEKAAIFGFLLMDATFFFGAIVSLILIRYINSKTILYIGAICNLFLIAGAIISYLQYSGLLSRDSKMFIYCFLGYMVFCNSGFNTITFVLAIEIMPVKHRGLGGALYNIITCILHFGSVKLLPYMILYINIWGTFLVFSVSGIICTLLLWRFVPETKGRTLQEIEDYYNYGSFRIKRNVVDNIDVNTPIVKSNI